MALVYNLAVKTKRMIAVRDSIDAGVGDGALEILDASNVLLASFTFSPVSGTVTGDTLTLSPASGTVTATAPGTPSQAQIKDGSGAAIITGLTAGTAGSSPDVVLDSATISSGQSVTLSSASIQHAV